MGILRKIISVLLILVATVAIIGVSIESSDIIYGPLMQSFSPFNFAKLGAALTGLLTGSLGMPFILLTIGFIGFTMPNPNKSKKQKG